MIKNIVVSNYDGKSLSSNYETTILNSFESYKNLALNVTTLEKWYIKNRLQDNSNLTNLSNTDI